MCCAVHACRACLPMGMCRSLAVALDGMGPCCRQSRRLLPGAFGCCVACRAAWRLHDCTDLASLLAAPCPIPSPAAVTDYLRQKVFGFPTAPGPDGRLVALVPPGFFCSNGEAGCDGGACGCAGGAADASSSGLSSSSGNADAGQQSSSGSGCGSGRQASGGHELVTVWRDNVRVQRL